MDGSTGAAVAATVEMANLASVREAKKKADEENRKAMETAEAAKKAEETRKAKEKKDAAKKAAKRDVSVVVPVPVPSEEEPVETKGRTRRIIAALVVSAAALCLYAATFLQETPKETPPVSGPAPSGPAPPPVLFCPGAAKLKEVQSGHWVCCDEDDTTMQTGRRLDGGRCVPPMDFVKEFSSSKCEKIKLRIEDSDSTGGYKEASYSERDIQFKGGQIYWTKANGDTFTRDDNWLFKRLESDETPTEFDISFSKRMGKHVYVNDEVASSYPDHHQGFDAHRMVNYLKVMSITENNGAIDVRQGMLPFHYHNIDWGVKGGISDVKGIWKGDSTALYKFDGALTGAVLKGKDGNVGKIANVKCIHDEDKAKAIYGRFTDPMTASHYLESAFDEVLEKFAEATGEDAKAKAKGEDAEDKGEDADAKGEDCPELWWDYRAALKAGKVNEPRSSKYLPDPQVPPNENMIQRLERCFGIKKEEVWDFRGDDFTASSSQFSASKQKQAASMSIFNMPTEEELFKATSGKNNGLTTVETMPGLPVPEVTSEDKSIFTLGRQSEAMSPSDSMVSMHTQPQDMSMPDLMQGGSLSQNLRGTGQVARQSDNLMGTQIQGQRRSTLLQTARESLSKFSEQVRNSNIVQNKVRKSNIVQNNEDDFFP